MAAWSGCGALIDIDMHLLGWPNEETHQSDIHFKHKIFLLLFYHTSGIYVTTASDMCDICGDIGVVYDSNIWYIYGYT